MSLSRPSLNLARDAEGHWNIERWLPPASQPGARPGFVGPLAPSRDVRAARPYRIDVDGGRINFKQGDNKSPFALVDVSGRVEQNGAGRWQLDLEARPDARRRRAAGYRHASACAVRLPGRPRAFSRPNSISPGAPRPLADALRLVRGKMTTECAASLPSISMRSIAPRNPLPFADADSGGAQWSISGVARLTGMHGWRLPEHDTDPAANLSVEMNWRLGERRAEIRKLLVEMPASRLQGTGDLDWAHGFQPQLHIESSTLALGDVLSWYRACSRMLRTDLRADCALGVDLKLGGWPIQFQQGAHRQRRRNTDGQIVARSAANRRPESERIARRNRFRADADFLCVHRLQRRSRDDTPPAASLRILSYCEVLLFPGPMAHSAGRRIGIFPSKAQPRACRIGWLFPRRFAQPDEFGLDRRGRPYGQDARSSSRGIACRCPWLGTMDFLGLTLSPAYVNQPVRLPKAHVEFAPLQRTITLSAAEAFGAVWHGSIARKYSDRAMDVRSVRGPSGHRGPGPLARPARAGRVSSRDSPARIPAVSAAPLADGGRHAARGARASSCRCD